MGPSFDDPCSRSSATMLPELRVHHHNSRRTEVPTVSSWMPKLTPTHSPNTRL